MLHAVRKNDRRLQVRALPGANQVSEPIYEQFNRSKPNLEIASLATFCVLLFKSILVHAEGALCRSYAAYDYGARPAVGHREHRSHKKNLAEFNKDVVLRSARPATAKTPTSL
jgi:hypothetical protein